MGDKDGGNEAAMARQDEQQRQQRIREGTTRINGIFDGADGKPGFNDEFFAGRRQAYMDYATPQIEDQYDKAQRALTFDLARSGTLDSSIRASKFGELAKLYGTQKQQAADQALAHETQARTAVEDSRANLIATLNATGDAEGAANSAIARSAALSQPSQFSPLTNLFADFTGALGTQAAQERAAALSGGAYKPKYNTGIFGVNGAVKNY